MGGVMQNFDSGIMMDCIHAGPLSTGKILKLELQAPLVDFPQWLKENLSIIEEKLAKYGGLLFRNFPIDSLSAFNKIAQILCPQLLDYVYRSTPRTKLGGKIYTATEYSNERAIPFHNENAYARSWPSNILFYSAVTASQGGETPIADSRNVYNKINPLIKAKFEEKGVLYVRNYIPGIDLSWQEVFQTSCKEEVIQYCMNNHIEFEWFQDSTHLRTKQICQATLTHPQTKEKVWFNQAHLFHPSALIELERSALIEALGQENLPRNVFYGDGEQIDEQTLSHIKQIYNEEKINFSWQRGDLMYLDNILMAHAREPYSGERKVVVAMGGKGELM